MESSRPQSRLVLFSQASTTGALLKSNARKPGDKSAGRCAIRVLGHNSTKDTCPAPTAQALVARARCRLLHRSGSPQGGRQALLPRGEGPKLVNPADLSAGCPSHRRPHPQVHSTGYAHRATTHRTAPRGAATERLPRVKEHRLTWGHLGVRLVAP